MGRLAVALALLLAAPLFSGCFFAEPLEVALRVRSHDDVLITGDRTFAGSVVVDSGGSLVLDGASVTIAQSLILAPGAVVSARASTLQFGGGGFEREDIESAGNLTLDETRVTGLRRMTVTGESTSTRNGSIEAMRLSVQGGTLASEGTAWRLGTAEGSSLGVGDGVVILRNLTLETHAPGGTAIVIEDGELELHDVTIVGERSRFLAARGGITRLFDTPHPAREELATHTGEGIIEVFWTVTVRAVSPPGNLPVGGLDVTLTSAHAPTRPTEGAVTDENGEARVPALQYAWGREGSRTGNPHAVRASGGGKEGAMVGIVVEGPTTVTVPVLG